MGDKGDNDVLKEIAALSKLTVGGLRKKYLEVFGEETRSSNKKYLFKKIAYRLQEKRRGGLSDRAQKRVEDLAKDAPIHRRPKLASGESTKKPARQRDPRLPAPGSLLKRTFRKKEHSVRVLEDGFKYQDKPYRSLSAIAREITGTSWNGFGFFGLLTKEDV